MGVSLAVAYTGRGGYPYGHFAGWLFRSKPESDVFERVITGDFAVAYHSEPAGQGLYRLGALFDLVFLFFIGYIAKRPAIRLAGVFYRDGGRFIFSSLYGHGFIFADSCCVFDRLFYGK